MKPTEVCYVLNDFLYYGLSQNIFDQVSTHRVSEGAEATSLYPENRLGVVGDGSICVDDYLSIINNRRFSGLFPDGSMFYTECTFLKGRLHEHRYLFIPSPFSTDVTLERPTGASLADWYETCISEYGVHCIRSTGMIRFDCARGVPEDVDDPHPVSHLTFASSACRIPVQGPFQVSSFLDFVFDNYFRPIRAHWLKFAPQMRLVSDERTITAPELLLHHFSWELEEA
jgi:hypothetical protein